MAGKKDHLPASQSSRQQSIGRLTERSFEGDPFLVGKTLDMIKAAAANYSDPMIRHARFIAIRAKSSEIWFERLSVKRRRRPGYRIALTNLLLTTNPTILMTHPLFGAK
jgi:hypothetical protein